MRGFRAAGKAGTRLRSSGAMIALAVAALASPAGATAPLFGGWGFDASGMDPAVRPGNDFFRYANGRWDTRTVIPDDRTSYGVDAVLSEAAEKQVRGILEADPGAVSGPAGADAVKVHAAYQAFMDTARIEAAGARPIAADLAAIRQADSRDALAGLMGRANVGFRLVRLRRGHFGGREDAGPLRRLPRPGRAGPSGPRLLLRTQLRREEGRLSGLCRPDADPGRLAGRRGERPAPSWTSRAASPRSAGPAPSAATRRRPTTRCRRRSWRASPPASTGPRS